MHQQFIKKSYVIFTLLSLFILLPQAFANQSTLPKAPYVAPQVVKQWLNENQKVTIVDVREPQEYEEGHLPGSINIPYRDIEQRASEINSVDPYVFYCIHSSWRAPYVANLLADKGHKNVYVLEGGVAAWNAGGQILYSSSPDQAPQVALYPQGLEKKLFHPEDSAYTGKINLTREELKTYNGQDGHPAYAAVDGIVYDVTQSRLWRGGVHDPGHGNIQAGQDLTEAIKESPHGKANLERFPVVGNLIN